MADGRHSDLPFSLRLPWFNSQQPFPPRATSEAKPGSETHTHSVIQWAVLGSGLEVCIPVLCVHGYKDSFFLSTTIQS